MRERQGKHALHGTMHKGLIALLHDGREACLGVGQLSAVVVHDALVIARQVNVVRPLAWHSAGAAIMREHLTG